VAKEVPSESTELNTKPLEQDEKQKKRQKSLSHESAAVVTLPTSDNRKEEGTKRQRSRNTGNE